MAFKRSAVRSRLSPPQSHYNIDTMSIDVMVRFLFAKCLILQCFLKLSVTIIVPGAFCFMREMSLFGVFGITPCNDLYSRLR